MALALLTPMNAWAASAPSNTAQSRSGQFSVSFPPALVSLTKFTPPPGDYVRFEPALLAVSCDRIKGALNRDLGLNAPWRGKIFLRLHSARAADEVVAIVTEKTSFGWNYRVELPSVMEQKRYVRTIV